METLRQYGQDHLAAMGEAEAVLKRHARYYLALGEEAERHLTGPQQVGWLSRLTVAFDNLRAAVGWCLEHGQAEVGLRLTGAIFWHAYLRGSVVEGRAWLERLLALEPAIPSAVRATAMSWTGVLALLEGSRAEAVHSPGPAMGDAASSQGIGTLMLKEKPRVRHRRPS